MKKLIALIAVLILVVIAGSLAIWELPTENQETVRIEILPGDTLSEKALQWQRDGWLPSADLLKLQAKLLKKTHLRPGEFDVPPKLSGVEFLHWLENAKPVTYRVSLIEGTRVSEALAALAVAPKLKQDIAPLNEQTVSEFLGVEGSLEGWLYPDTYVYPSGEAVSVVLIQSYERMKRQLEQAWQARQKDLPYQTPYQALIMASIVEKETAVPSERPEIAGVFVRRLRKDMRLETDPTVIYGLGSEYSGNLRKKHLLDKTNLYNTYRHKGLPPGPIALAGREALDAALNPAAGKTLFFVAKGDGSHVFSETLSQHTKAVRQYQIYRRKKDYRSTPVAN
ncbi:MAG: endolytic transglycosylase MltG [Oceanobacter sp.]